MGEFGSFVKFSYMEVLQTFRSWKACFLVVEIHESSGSIAAYDIVFLAAKRCSQKSSYNAWLAKILDSVVHHSILRWCLNERGRVEETTRPWVIRGGRGQRKPCMWKWRNQEVVRSSWGALCEWNQRPETAQQKRQVIRPHQRVNRIFYFKKKGGA